jgi:hypothetical protein
MNRSTTMAELIIFVICAALSIAASIYRLQLPADEQQCRTGQGMRPASRYSPNGQPVYVQRLRNSGNIVSYTGNSTIWVGC